MMLGCADCLERQVRDGRDVGTELAPAAVTVVDGRAYCLNHAKARIERLGDQPL